MISFSFVMVGRCLGCLFATGCVLVVACGGRLVKQYEYEEEVFVSLDGSATVIINSSVPALVALRGAPIDPDPRARFDRTAVRHLSGGGRTARVSRPWRRNGRRFFQLRLVVDDLTRLSELPLFAWSTYEFRQDGEQVIYRQSVGPAADRAGPMAWRGDELVAFRLHLPSRVLFHNAPSGRVERGNILVWEQPLGDRLADVPLTIEAGMGHESILHRTLWLFAAAFAAAVSFLGGAVWLMARRQPRPAATGTSA